MLKKLWNAIKGLGFRSVWSTCPKFDLRKKDSDEIVFDGDYVVNGFNNLFCSVEGKIWSTN